MCFIVGEEEAFKSACKKIEVTIRESVINDLLCNKDKKIETNSLSISV
jgi:exodeoxyribonuclease V alpha subunit